MQSLAVKRFVDIAGASAALVLAALPMAVIAAAVRATLGKPVLFRQQRPGIGAAPFTLVKFRTMRHGPEPDEQRLTRFGRFLRSMSLDELPELLNVLRGDMSLVGPRPLLVDYLDRYTPEQARRHELRPGITGMAQISGRNTQTWEERLALDVWYVDHWTNWGDVAILARTLGLVVRREGIRDEGHATKEPFGGPLDAHPAADHDRLVT